MKITSLDLKDLELQAENQLSNFDPELPQDQDVSEIMQGVKTWKNQVNGFRVIMLHRTADPSKRSAEWVKNTRKDLSTSMWLVEYELHWEVLDGRPVYQDEFSREFHVSKRSLGWNPKLVVCRGWDFGLYPACVFAQLFPFSRLIILRECVGEDIDTERFTYEVSRLSNEWFPDATFYDFIDPTGKNRAGTDGRAYTRILTKKPLNAKRIILGANAKVARRNSVVDFLKDNIKGLPALLIDPSCEMLIKGFDGGYIYAFNQGTIKTDPEKNIFSHIHDSLQYLASKVRTANLRIDAAAIRVAEARFGNGVPITITPLINNRPVEPMQPPITTPSPYNRGINA